MACPIQGGSKKFISAAFAQSLGLENGFRLEGVTMPEWMEAKELSHYKAQTSKADDDDHGDDDHGSSWQARSSWQGWQWQSSWWSDSDWKDDKWWESSEWQSSHWPSHDDEAG